jgi:hypothetical protein
VADSKSRLLLEPQTLLFITTRRRQTLKRRIEFLTTQNNHEGKRSKSPLEDSGFFEASQFFAFQVDLLPGRAGFWIMPRIAESLGPVFHSTVWQQNFEDKNVNALKNEI